MVADGRVCSDELVQVTLSRQLKVLGSSRSTGKGAPDFQWSVVSGGGRSRLAAALSLA